MFNVDTRTILTLARLHQDDLTASFARKRRVFRPSRRHFMQGSLDQPQVGALSAPSPFQPPPEASGA